MAWETRGNRTYYYTAERVGGKVVKQYWPPLMAEAAAMIQQDKQDMRASDAAIRRTARAELDELAALLDPLNELADAVAAAAMLAAGYHRHHRGPWRKRRHA